MINNRKLAFVLSALMIAGFGLSACEEQDLCPECRDSGSGSGSTGTNSGTTGNTYKYMSSYKNLNGAKSECKEAKCSSSSSCKSGEDYVACQCVTDTELCHAFSICNGVGSCKYECGESAESCGWAACAEDDACSAENALAGISAGNALDCASSSDCKDAMDFCSALAALNPSEDFDEDGLINSKELEGNFAHPCFKDTDGDQLADNVDDKPWETTTTGCEEARLKSQFCKAFGGEGGQFKDMTIAKLPGSAYTPDNDTTGEVTTFSDGVHKIVGFFGSGKSQNGAQLLKAAGLTPGTYVEESNFTAAVPLGDWKSKGYKGDWANNHDSDEYQVVPDSDVLRLKYSVNTEGKPLEEIVTMIADVFGNAQKPSTTTKCDNDEAILYLARSSYTDGSNKFRIYSGAMACLTTRSKSEQKDSTSIAAMNLMDDVLSGTLVAPKHNAYSLAPTNGYVPYKNNICQTSKIGDASGAVDFIWVLDNSGSMADELENVSKTAEIFANRLAGSGIDYRVAVTTTDAYAIEEPGVIATVSNKVKKNDFTTYNVGSLTPLGAKYYNAIGIRTATNQQMADNPGFLYKSASIYIPKGTSEFSTAIKADPKCTVNGGNNTCGIGYEDGFQSGALTLSRLAVEIGSTINDTKYEKSDFNASQQAAYDDIVTLKTHLSKGEYEGFTGQGGETVDKLNALTLRHSALKYIIWVSDEESRQFKEDGDVVRSTTGNDVLSYTDANNNGPYYACLTGKKLENGSLSTVPVTPDNGAQVCNPTIRDDLENAISSNIAEVADNPTLSLIQDKTFDELKAIPSLKGYTDMLEYYLKEYQRFAGSGGIAGFALVGDIGNRNGGVCSDLKACKGTCFKDAYDQTGHPATSESGCFDCMAEGSTDRNTGWFDSATAKDGANYGLSYIHLARFLSTYNPDGKSEEGKAGKEGGFGSICSKNFDTTINSIFEDISGRVASHTLWGYPISPTIRVAIIQKGCSTQYTELKRGESTHGFTYDASQNAVVFTGVSDISKSSDDWFAISYDIWDRNQG